MHTILLRTADRGQAGSRPLWMNCPLGITAQDPFHQKLDTCKVRPHGQHQGQDHRDHRRRPRHRIRDRQGAAGPRRAGGHRRPRRRPAGVGRRRTHQARPGLRLSARRHRPGVVRDVPRQGAHRRRRPHRRADQQRRRDADRAVPRPVRAGDPLLDRGEPVRRDRRLPVGAARDGRPPQRPHHQHRVAVRADPRARPGGLRRRQVRAWSGCLPRWPTRWRHTASRSRCDAAVHQHRVDLRHQDLGGATSRWSPRTSPRPSSRCWTSRRRRCRCRRRGGSPRGRADAAAQAASLARTRARTDTVFLDFDTKARQGYEQRAQAAQGVVEGPEKS